MRRFFTLVLDFWREVRGNAKYDLFKWGWVQLGGPSMIAIWTSLKALPWWGSLLIFVGIYLFVGLMLFLWRRVSLIKIEAVPNVIFYRPDGNESEHQSNCEIEIYNLSGRAITNVSAQITGLEFPVGLGPPGKIIPELPCSSEGDPILLPGDKLAFILLRDARRVDAFGKQAVMARAIGNWGGNHVFLLGKSRHIRIKVTGKDMPVYERTFSFGFSSETARFILGKA